MAGNYSFVFTTLAAKHLLKKLSLIGRKMVLYGLFPEDWLKCSSKLKPKYKCSSADREERKRKQFKVEVVINLQDNEGNVFKTSRSQDSNKVNSRDRGKKFGVESNHVFSLQHSIDGSNVCHSIMNIKQLL